MDRCTAKNAKGARCWLQPGHTGPHLVDGRSAAASAVASCVAMRRNDSVSVEQVTSKVFSERLERMGEMSVNDLLKEWSR